MARSDPPAASMTRDPTRGTVSWPHSQQRCPPCSRSIMEGPDGVSLLSPFGSWICFPVDVMLRCRLDASQLQFTGQAAGWTRAGVGNWPHGARARAPGAGGRPHERQRTHVASGRRRRKGEERAAGTGPRGRRARPAPPRHARGWRSCRGAAYSRRGRAASGPPPPRGAPSAPWTC